MNNILHGLVVAAFGRQYQVELDNGSVIPCLTRGKRSEAVCGDIVELHVTAHTSSGGSAGIQGVIERISPRQSLLYRSEGTREKMLAANVTQVIVVVAPEPPFSDELLARCLIAASAQKLNALIVLNKRDLPTATAACEQLSIYASIGYHILELSARQDVSALRPFLRGHISVLIGQSGMGKSTLINALFPEARAATAEISKVLNSGKHTTTHARLYRIDQTTMLIDCPGVQSFGLHHLSFGKIEQGFVEFAPYLGECRFQNCRHLHEPGCALLNAVAQGRINSRRMALFQRITST